MRSSREKTFQMLDQRRKMSSKYICLDPLFLEYLSYLAVALGHHSTSSPPTLYFIIICTLCCCSYICPLKLLFCVFSLLSKGRRYYYFIIYNSYPICLFSCHSYVVHASFLFLSVKNMLLRSLSMRFANFVVIIWQATSTLQQPILK